VRRAHHAEPADFPILYVEGVRDLLVVAIAPELEKWISDHPAEPGVAYHQALVAFVLDSLTVSAIEQLARERREAEPPPPCD
jgi:hypothetical protein